MYLSAREREVIELLLKTEKAITIQHIAKKLHVSERTIHRDFKHIETVLNDYGLKLIKKAGDGVRAAGSDSAKASLIKAISGTAHSEFTPKERQTMILSTLLAEDEPIKLFTLASELGVTTATISHDLDELEAELQAYDLNLIRKRGYGIQLEGSEKNKRAIIRNLIANDINPFEFVLFLRKRKEYDTQQSDVISNRLLGLVSPEKLSVIEQQLEQIKTMLHYEWTDSAYIGLVVHIALVVERIQKGGTIAFDNDYMTQLKETEEYVIAKTLIRHLEYALDMSIPEAEVGYITMHLMGAKTRNNQQYLIEDSSLDVAYLVKGIVKHVSKELDIDLTHNIALLNDLVAHLKPSLYRLKQGLKISNPMLGEIRSNYDELFEVLQNAVKAIIPDIHFPDSEIAYLVLHFAAVLVNDEKESNKRALAICSSGIGTAKILATKLKQEVPEIKYVENKSLFDLENTAADNYDVIVSTIPLNEEMFDYVLASPILTKAEADKIKRKIRTTKTAVFQKAAKPLHTDSTASSVDYKQELKKMQTYAAAAQKILDSIAVQQVPDDLSLEEILDSVCCELAKDGVVENVTAVTQALLRRQETNGLGIPGTQLALYHTRSHEVTKPSFTVYLLDQPLRIKGMDGSIQEVCILLLMLAPRDIKQEVLEILSLISSLVIEENCMKLLYAGDENQIEDYFSKQIYQWLREKL